MTKPTGRPPGRPKGSKSKRTVERAEQVQRVAIAVESLLDEPFEGDAHAYLMSVYKDKTQAIEKRLDAAGKAIGFEKPKLAAIDVTSQNEHVVHAVSRDPLTPEQWLEQAA